MAKRPLFRREREAALKVANLAREKLGLPPMDHLFKGKRDIGSHCPITMTVYDDDLDRNRYTVLTDGSSIAVDDRLHLGDEALIEVGLPAMAQRFVAAFDEGRMPDLDISLD